MWVGNSHARCRAGENSETRTKNYLLLYGLIFHQSKQYLKFCFNEIENFLDKEHLKLNNKSRIYKNTNNFMFLGRDRKGKYSKYRNIKRKIKLRKRLYEDNKIELIGYINTINCYKNLKKKL